MQWITFFYATFSLVAFSVDVQHSNISLRRTQTAFDLPQYEPFKQLHDKYPLLPYKEDTFELNASWNGVSIHGDIDYCYEEDSFYYTFTPREDEKTHITFSVGYNLHANPRLVTGGHSGLTSAETTEISYEAIQAVDKVLQGLGQIHLDFSNISIQ